MSNPLPLTVWDRSSGQHLQEFMDDSPATYESRPHRSLTNWMQSSPAFDQLVAVYQNTRLSARKIEPFVKKHGIDMSEFEPGPFNTYADFFDRRFRPGVRFFPSAPNRMGAFAEARYYGWTSVLKDQEFPIKGHSLNAEGLLGNASRAAPFVDGPVLLARLAPVDYHHLHYPDDGQTCEQDRMGRNLWTVNRNALQAQPDIYLQNERSIQILDTTHFGRLGFVEIGALSVGRIVQVHPPNAPFKRGDEKSVFKFGGSAVIVFGERGRWRPSPDILQKTSEGIEVRVRLGEPIASVDGAV
jgi:phosphatidylserine decarboxylase